MTPRISLVAVCCSTASFSFFSRSPACALSFFTSDAWDSSDRATPPLAFVPVERSLRTPVRLFAPVRAKVTLERHVDRPRLPRGSHHGRDYNTAWLAPYEVFTSVPRKEAGAGHEVEVAAYWQCKSRYHLRVHACGCLLSARK